jgi:hypothetical protein
VELFEQSLVEKYFYLAFSDFCSRELKKPGALEQWEKLLSQNGNI